MYFATYFPRAIYAVERAAYILLLTSCYTRALKRGEISV